MKLTPQAAAAPVLRNRAALDALPDAPHGLTWYAVGPYCWGRSKHAAKAVAAARAEGSAGWYVLNLVNAGAEVDPVDGRLDYAGSLPGVKPAAWRYRAR